ncbi:MAG: NAD(P)-binding protein [Gemmatimonadota bacterium]
MSRTLETDYLVIGGGAAGLAFVDTLVAESDARVVIVDRRAAAGGHWNDAYSFVRLHQPSLYYGVNSTPPGTEAVQTDGPEAGWYDRATGTEIRAYYERVMQRHLIPTGRVRFFPKWEFVGGLRIASCLTGEVVEVKVRKKVVNAAYLSPSIPATSPPPFEVGAGASVIPIGRLTQVGHRPERFVIIGAGKTAMDACVWLLQSGVDPEQIQWIKPRESWVINRAYTQPGELVANLFEGITRQMAAAARATSVDDLFDRLEAAALLRRVDANVQPTMFRSATVGDWEIDLLRRIEKVVRLGHVHRIECDRIVLDEGTMPTTPGHLHVHCAADGLPRSPAIPIFGANRITLQPVRTGLIPFNAALVAFVEARRDEEVEKNRLCPPNPHPRTALDWARTTIIQPQAERAWSQETDIVEWLERSRLNPLRGLSARAGDPGVQAASKRFVENIRPGLGRLAALTGGAAA